MRPTSDPEVRKDPRRMQLTLPEEIYIRIHATGSLRGMAPSAVVADLVREHLPPVSTATVQTVEK